MSGARKILFASGNQGKLKEVRAVASKYGFEILAPDEIGKGWPDVVEYGTTYQANARLKAEAFFTWSGVPTLADDSGIEVQLLAGAPGVHSARYAGEQASDAENRAKLLGELRGQASRQARFTCVLCLKQSPGDPLFVEANLDGEIAEHERGSAGFGYDSIFIVGGAGKTLAELKGTAQEPKTHRVKALEALFASLLHKAR